VIERRIAELVARDLEDIDAVFINGGRQTGKSTFAEAFGGQYKKVVYASFDDVTLRSAEMASPGQTFADIEEGLVILDEIQHVPLSFLALKSKIDELRRKKKKAKFLLTGSADIMLLPKLAEALVGRMYVRTMYPFSAAEVLNGPGVRGMDGGAFIKNLFKAPPDITRQFTKPDIPGVLAQATFPQVSLEIKNKEPWFRNYINTLLERDVKNFSDIDRIEIFPRMLSILANRVGGLVNDADMSMALKVSQPTVKRYHTLLNGVFLTYLLPPWFKSIEKRLVKSPKIYFTDTLLLCHLLGLLPGEIRKTRPELYGFVLENFVASELNKELSLMDDGKLFHFRTSDKKEIDFIVEDRNGRILAIEVKASSAVVGDDFRHIRFLQNTLPDNFARGVVLYQGDKAVRFDRDLYALPLSALWE
jgi:predicted AAA+ superfamily ATPase